MKIEIDTKEASREELEHLANLLLATAGKQPQTVSTIQPSTSGLLDSQSYTQPVQSAPESVVQPVSNGLFSLFDDDPEPVQSQSSSQSYSAPEPVIASSTPSTSTTPTGGMFSLFADDSVQSQSEPVAQPIAQSVVQPVQSQVCTESEPVTQANDMFAMLNNSESEPVSQVEIYPNSGVPENFSSSTSLNENPNINGAEISNTKAQEQSGHAVTRELIDTASGLLSDIMKKDPNDFNNDGTSKSKGLLGEPKVETY